MKFRMAKVYLQFSLKHSFPKPKNRHRNTNFWNISPFYQGSETREILGYRRSTFEDLNLWGAAGGRRVFGVSEDLRTEGDW